MTNLKRLFPYLAPHKKHIGLAILATTLSGALDGAFLVLAEYVLKPLLSPESGQTIASRLSQLNFFVGALLVFAIFRACVDFTQQYLTQRTGQRILFKLREDLFAHFQTLSIAFFEKKRTGEVMSRLTNDVGALQTLLTTALVNLTTAPLAMALALGYMIYKNWQLSIFVILILPPVGWLVSRAGRRIRSAISQLQNQNAVVTDYLQEKVSAMRLIQTFGTTGFENGLFRATNEKAYRATMRPIRVQSSLGPTIEFTGMCGVVLCLWFGSRQVMQGNMDPEALLVFIFAMHRVAMRFKAIANLSVTLKSAETAAGRLWEIFDTQPEIQNAPNALKIEKSQVAGHLKFEDVRFAYAGGPDVLRGINFEIRPGQVVALAGLSGGGKTTVASLLPRLYDPTGGKITLDGHDLRELEVQSLRNLIGAVPQDVTLFHGTVRDNIAYARPDATLEEIEAAARRAHAHEFIEKLPQGYDSPVGERGVGFSGGQKQRLAIARALLRDPKLLILDEATSALDAESEGLVQDALAELMRGRTTLVIAHRFSTIIGADQILVLEAGEIIERGTHRELLAREGKYSELYHKQSFQARRGDVVEDDAQNEAQNSETSAVALA